MPLPPYTQYFTHTSLQRTEDYIDSVKIAKVGERMIKAKVWGTYKYKVKIEWNEQGEYSYLDCSSPYDYNGCSKHIGAVLLFLEDKPDKMQMTSKFINTSFEEIGIELPDQIFELDNNQLIELIEKLANANSQGGKIINNYLQTIYSVK